MNDLSIQPKADVDTGTKPTPEEGTYLAGLPERFRDEPSLQKFNSAEDMLDNYLALERYKGRSLSAPKEDATDDQRAEFLSKLQTLAPELTMKPTDTNMAEYNKLMGVPDSPEGYGVPEGFDGDASLLQAKAQALGMTPAQYNQWIDTEIKEFKANQDRYTEQVDAATQELHSEWGAAHNDRYNAAAAAARHVSEADAAAFLDGTATAELVRTYYKISTIIGKEGVILGGDKEVVSDRLTPGEAQEEIDSIMDKLVKLPMGDPSRNELLKRKSELFKMVPSNNEGVTFKV